MSLNGLLNPSMSWPLQECGFEGVGITDTVEILKHEATWEALDIILQNFSNLQGLGVFDPGDNLRPLIVYSTCTRKGKV